MVAVAKPVTSEWLFDQCYSEPNTGCWLWGKGRLPYGYGLCRRMGERLAHRLSYIVHAGPIPAGMQVLHRCDVPACINPSHLVLGTQLDNVRDMIAKGRMVMSRRASGDDHYARRRPQALARGDRHGCRTKPESIRRGSDHWHAHTPEAQACGEQVCTAKLTDESVREIRAAYAAGGVSFVKLGKRYGVDQALIARVVHRKSWAHVD